MTAEMDELPVVSKVELDGKSVFNLSLCQDLPNIGGHCNGIVHHSAVEIDGDAMDDTDSAYVFVNGVDTVSDDPVDRDPQLPSGIDHTEAVVTEQTVLEFSLSSPIGEIQVEFDTFSVANIQNDQSCISSLNNDAIVKNLEDETRGDEGERCNDDDDVKEDNKTESSAEILSGDQTDTIKEQNKVKSTAEISNQDEVESHMVNDQNKIGSATKVEGNLKSLITDKDADQSELHILDNDEEKVDVEIKIKSTVEEVNQESQLMETEPIESELQQLDNGDEKNGDQNKSESSAEVEGNQKSLSTDIDADQSELHNLDNDEEQLELEIKKESTEEEENPESQVMKTEAIESELQQLENREEKNGDQNKSESSAEVEENTESQIMVIETIEAELHRSPTVGKNQEFQVAIPKDAESKFDQLSNVEKKEAAEVVDEIPREGSLEDLEMEPVAEVESAACTVNNTHLETEARNGHDESEESLPASPVKHIVSETRIINVPADESNITELKFENTNGSVIRTESWPTCPVNDIGAEAKVKIPLESSESLPSCPVDASKSEAEVGIGSIEAVESGLTTPAGDVNLEAKIDNGSYGSVTEVPDCPVDDVDIGSKVVNGSFESENSFSTYSVNVDMDTEVMNASVQSGNGLPTFPAGDMDLESEVGDVCAANSREIPNANAVILESAIQNGSIEKSESASHCVVDGVFVDNEGDQDTSGDIDGIPIPQEVEVIGRVHKDEKPQSFTEDSTANVLDEQKLDVEVGKRPFRFLIRIPRYVDDELRNQIRIAQLQVDEKTQSRDAIRAEIQMKRVTCSAYHEKFEASRSEERDARDALNAKRQEIDSVQSVITKMKNATSIEDIDERVHNIEHMIEHETMPLKEEKHLIREIKQLKQLREQLSSTIGRQAELQQVLGQRERIEERFKLLKQEADSLRTEVLRMEGVTKAAKSNYFDENDKLKELKAQFKAADDLRQEAYTHLQNLKKELYEKNKYFRMYIAEAKAANDFAFARDREALQRLCVNEVETVMELWNKNHEFRNEYIRCNTMSTLRRLGTLDGRSLGPDEEPPVTRNFVDERVNNSLLASAKINSTLHVSTSEREISAGPIGLEKADAESVVNWEKVQPTFKSKKAIKPTSLENGSSTVSGREDTDKEAEEMQTKEQEKLARKEELRKEEAAAKLKELRRLEKVKAKEAEDRKRRNVEKAQARAEVRARKEAELKEKEREKKARKKERKKASTADATNSDVEGEAAPSSENATLETTGETEVKEKSTKVMKRPQKSSSLAKQPKTNTIPPPLRNKAKRKMQSWMWVLLMALFVLALFLVGNSGFSFKFDLSSFGF